MITSPSASVFSLWSTLSSLSFFPSLLSTLPFSTEMLLLKILIMFCISCLSLQNIQQSCKSDAGKPRHILGTSITSMAQILFSFVYNDTTLWWAGVQMFNPYLWHSTLVECPCIILYSKIQLQSTSENSRLLLQHLISLWAIKHILVILYSATN